MLRYGCLRLIPATTNSHKTAFPLLRLRGGNTVFVYKSQEIPFFARHGGRDGPYIWKKLCFWGLFYGFPDFFKIRSQRRGFYDTIFTRSVNILEFRSPARKCGRCLARPNRETSRFGSGFDCDTMFTRGVNVQSASMLGGSAALPYSQRYDLRVKAARRGAGGRIR